MKRWDLSFCLILFSHCFLGCATLGPKVQVTLSDGQKVVGYLATQSLTLASSLGNLTFDTAEAGELGLVEEKEGKPSDNKVRLWLRNGSEFVGQWQKPSITVGMEVGGKLHSIQVPIEKLKRLQFQGKDIWPNQAVFRIVTRYGDDFFVNVTLTQMTFSNEMGTFSPFLSEIRQLEPMDEQNQQWKIHLENQSIFIAKLEQDTLDLRLEMGPKELKLPLASVQRMNREYLAHPQKFNSFEDYESEVESGFFSNQRQKAAKDEAERQSQK